MKLGRVMIITYREEERKDGERGREKGRESEVSEKGRRVMIIR